MLYIAKSNSMEKFIEELARKAGEIVMGYYKKGIKAIPKASPTDVVTDADFKANRYLVDTIKEALPDHGIISEEMGSENTDAEYVWVIDPLDGTNNFSKGIPMFGVVISLTKKMEPQFSAIYDPVADEYIMAKAGQGVFLNGVKTECSKIKKITDSWGCLYPFKRPKDAPLWNKFLELELKKEFAFSAYGSACKTTQFVASGRRDWIISFDSYIWDLIPEIHILRESGCKVTNFSGEEWKPGDIGFIAANPDLHKELIKTFIIKGKK